MRYGVATACACCAAAATAWKLVHNARGYAAAGGAAVPAQHVWRHMDAAAAVIAAPPKAKAWRCGLAALGFWRRSVSIDDASKMQPVMLAAE